VKIGDTFIDYMTGIEMEVIRIYDDGSGFLAKIKE
jgi:hypothetical protein